MTENEIQKMIEDNIYFAGTLSPGSHGLLTNLPCLYTIYLIIYDIDALNVFTPDEYTAIILHEIGHSFNPEIHGEYGEFAADDFAINKGYDQYIASGLRKGKQNNMIGFDVPINNRRIERI